MKKKKNDRYLYGFIFLIIILIVLVVFSIRALLNRNKNKVQPNSATATNSQGNNGEDYEEIPEDEEIRTLHESDRMKRYIGIFFDRLEDKDYQSAYDVLNSEFKASYFPTLDDFKQYADKNFNTSTMSVTYDNIERLGNNKTGNLYVMWLTISNIFQRKIEDDEDKLEQTYFVILEKDYNNYEMSFSVKEG